MSDFLSAVMPHLLEAFGIVAASVISWVAFKASSFINSRVKNQDLQTGLLAVNNAIWTSVREIEQTGRKALSEAQANDGEIDKEELQKIKEKLKADAVLRAKEIGGQQGISLLKTAIGEIDIEKYLDARIEAEIHELRKDEK